MTEPTTLRMGLIRKKAEWTDEAFRSHWRDRHGPLVAQLPTLRSYRQNLVLDRLQRGIDFARGPWDFDGFSQLGFDEGAQADAAFNRGELAAAIRADEERFLGGLHIVTVAQTEVVALPPNPRGLLKRISLLRRPSEQSEDDFRREWKVHADHVRRMPGVSGYRQNVVTAREFVKGAPCGYAELPIDGIVELWFEDTDTLDAAFSSPQGQVTMAHALTFLAEITAFVVYEHRVV
ncbi:EthD domain-containing protein [Variovorax sp. CAN2819]|uniref:EthD domain-containing protein n=1 Tax=Variovorax sp. CAN15 TaxID=3046727 RepID=UPI002648C112|nr:EthD domain-containing protein [Variovorax sp. CAN15]MDN6883688.1 EthD domain-containing protein [Variovorax sp. CAN15]